MLVTKTAHICPHCHHGARHEVIDDGNVDLVGLKCLNTIKREDRKEPCGMTRFVARDEIATEEMKDEAK